MNSIITRRFIKCHDKLRDEGRIKSSRQFSLALDYLPQSFSEIMKGRRDVTIELIRKGAEKFQINPTYIFTGEGPMFMTEESDKGFRVLTIVKGSGGDDERIVHVPIPAQSGYAGDSVDTKFIQELPTFSLPEYKYRVGTHRSFDVAGDSMEPTLFEGDKVVCSFIDPTLWDVSIKDNYVYVVVTRGDVLVKRVINRLSNFNQLELLSDNNFYEPFRLDSGDIREIWYVRAKISPFLPSPSNINHILRDEVRELQLIVRNQSGLIENLQITLDKLVNR